MHRIEAVLKKFYFSLSSLTRSEWSFSVVHAPYRRNTKVCPMAYISWVAIKLSKMNTVYSEPYNFKLDMCALKSLRLGICTIIVREIRTRNMMLL